VEAAAVEAAAQPAQALRRRGLPVPELPSPERFVRAAGRRLGGLRSRRVAAAAGAIGAVALITGVIVGAELPGSSKGASQPKAAGAATVQRRDLVSTDTESGTLGYANPQTVYNRVSGTITWLPAVGRKIKPGGTLYRVDNSPVILFDGTTPAYRTLSSGVSNGPDVQELNANLVALGFDPSHEISVDDTWQTGTTDAVDRWQAALGETETGTVTLGQVVFLPGPQLVTTVETVLGSTGASAGSSGAGSSGTGSSSGSGSSGTGSGTSASLSTSGSSHAEFVSLTSTTRTPKARSGPTGPTGPSGPTNNSHSSKTSTTVLKALAALLKAETAELRSKGSSSAGGASAAGAASRGGGGSAGGSASGGGGSASGGSSGGASSGSGSASAILQTTSVQEVVTVDLDATKQTEAVVGEPVSVELPDGSTTNGKITQVSPVAQSSSSSGSSGGSGSGSSSSTPSATIPVTITLTGHSHVSGLDQAAVSVNFAQQKANNVLSVPVTALIATQGGGYAVQKATAPHTLVPVTPGLFAAGYVQISGSGIYPGLQVTDSQG
jgi:hypothetical protein